MIRAHSIADWAIAIITVSVFILSFIIYFSETHEIFSSLTAAIFTAILVFGALFIMRWVVRAFMK